MTFTIDCMQLQIITLKDGLWQVFGIHKSTVKSQGILQCI